MISGGVQAGAEGMLYAVTETGFGRCTAWLDTGGAAITARIEDLDVAVAP